MGRELPEWRDLCLSSRYGDFAETYAQLVTEGLLDPTTVSFEWFIDNFENRPSADIEEVHPGEGLATEQFAAMFMVPEALILGIDPRG